MADQNFTDFTLKTPASNDFLVGYNADGSDEYRTTITNIKSALGLTSTDNVTFSSLSVSNGISAINPSTFVSSSTEPTLRITQTGSGHVFEAGDIEHPDSSPVIIDQYGTLVVGASSAPGTSSLASRNTVFVSSSTANKRVTEFRNHGTNPTNFAEIRLVRSRAQTSNDFEIYPLLAGDTLGAYTTTATTGSLGSRIITTNKNDSASGTVSGCRVEFQAHVADVGLTSTLTINEDKVGIGTTDPNEILTVVGNISAAGAIYASNIGEGGQEWVAVPASSTSTGIPGQKAFDSNYLYICVNTNTWKRTILASW